MSNWPASPSTPIPSSSTRSSGTPPVCGRPSPSSSGPATRRTRSVAKRSLPAETGVWIVKTLSARTRSRASSSAVAGRDVLPGPLREQERRVALVEVPDRRLDAERPQRPDPADAEDELLVEPHLAAADVEDVGDRPVGVAVVGDVGVEQEHRRPADLGEPDRDLEVATRQLDLDLERLAGVGLDAADRQVGSGRSRGRRAPGGRRRRSSGGSSRCDRAARRRRTAGPCRTSSSCGRRRARRGRRSRSRATRRCRTRRRSRRWVRRGRRRGSGRTRRRSRSPCTRRTRGGRPGPRP